MSNPSPLKSAAAKGGSVTAAESPAKAKALKALHARRRGKRLNPDSRDRAAVLSDVLAIVRDPEGDRSKKGLARHLRVSDRTVRRWLCGKSWPTPVAIEAMKIWCREQT